LVPPEFNEAVRNIPIKKSLYVGREADGSFLAEMQDGLTDVVVRIGVLETIGVDTGFSHRQSLVNNGLRYIIRRHVGHSDHENPDKVQQRFEEGGRSATDTMLPLFAPTVDGLDYGAG